MSIPRVSFGLPVRNGGAYLHAAVHSLLSQTEQDFELIISDNGSNDGSSVYLKSLADCDRRVQYYYQEPPLRAYDNFHFVLAKATGKYFMWAAHDDTRDPDFVERLASSLDSNDRAVLSFGDLNIVTPDDREGSLASFPFDTRHLQPLARLRKLSLMQCYYIYGLWRMSEIKKVPYAYCAWWPDLPMMLAMGFLGEFIHVPHTRFNYLELPKTNISRVKSQDYSNRFNLVVGVWGLVRATFVALEKVGGIGVGLYGAILIVRKQAINLPGFLMRRALALVGLRRLGA